MTRNCASCGCKLDKTNWGRYYCMNCGMVDENQDREESESNGETPSYIG